MRRFLVALAVTLALVAAVDAGTFHEKGAPGRKFSSGVASSTTYSQAVLADAPYAYWRLNDTSGTTAVDSGIGASNGTYIGGCTLNQAGPLTSETSKSVLFNGSSGRVSVNFAPGFANSTWTIECWANTSSSASDRGLFNAWTDDSTAKDLVLRFGSGGYFRAGYYNDDLDTNSSFYTTSTWIHVAVTRNHGTDTTTIYKNGSSYTSGAAGPFTGASPVTSIGAEDNLGGFGNWWTGYICEVAIWDSDIGASKIAAHYAAR